VFNLAFIRCPDGVLRDYAEYEDIIKPKWKEAMKKEYFRRYKTLRIILPAIGGCLVVIGLCSRLSLFIFGKMNYWFVLFSYFLFIFLIIGIISTYISKKEGKNGN